MKECIVRRTIWFLLFTAVVWGTAVSCSPTVEDDSPAPVDENDGGALEAAPETDDAVFPRPTLTPVPLPLDGAGEPDDVEGYPAAPAPTPFPEGYVAPPTIPALNPYPEASGTLVWVIKPVGEQCAETPTTPDLQTAVADMVAFGIPVEASEMTNLPVCMSCGCPTSAHFRLQIDAGYLGNAEVLGWFAEE